jgi:hypothetical protein
MKQKNYFFFLYLFLLMSCNNSNPAETYSEYITPIKEKSFIGKIKTSGPDVIEFKLRGSFIK